jgi:pyruvate dehydrogenase E2 component (dihydrolipoamide acetyltransferase)
MRTDVVMPQMGESIFEGTITKWLKKVGDHVERDEPLFEISTDKVDAEIPSPAAGILTEIQCAEGLVVEVNAVVAVIDDTQESDTASSIELRQLDTSSTANLSPLTPALTTPKEASPHAAICDQQIRTSPLVRRIARENNLDLRAIQGTGSQGRITKEDILRFLTASSTQMPVQLPAATAPEVLPLEETPGGAPSQASEAVPLSRMRAIIAQRMVDSVRISPHVHTVYRIDMTRIVRLRNRERARFEQYLGVKLTFMPFIAMAATKALLRFPIINAALECDPNGRFESAVIRYHSSVNLGIAVALEWGLIVPVVHQADRRSFADLARCIADLTLRARAKKLLPEEVGGGTFTLTNTGVLGDEFGVPIINQPESAILGCGALKKEPIVLPDADGNDTIAIRSVQHFCLGFDHRLIDGADAGKFMSEFKRLLEAWEWESTKCELT